MIIMLAVVVLECMVLLLGIELELVEMVVVVARFTCRRLSMKSPMTASQPLSSSSTDRVMVGVAVSFASSFFLASASEQWRSSTSCLSWQTFSDSGFEVTIGKQSDSVQSASV